MPFVEIMLIAVGLALDAFAVSLAAGAGGLVSRLRPALRLSFHLGLFQFMMPVLGWLAGSQVADLIAPVDHWVAFGLLAFVGTRMIVSGRSRTDERQVQDPSKGMTMVMLSVATSIDAFAVGLSLAMIGVGIWYPSAMIGVITCGLSLLGIRLGGWLGAAFGKRMEIVGGLILITIGARIVIEHLG